MVNTGCDAPFLFRVDFHKCVELAIGDALSACNAFIRVDNHDPLVIKHVLSNGVLRTWFNTQAACRAFIRIDPIDFFTRRLYHGVTAILK